MTEQWAPNGFVHDMPGFGGRRLSAIFAPTSQPMAESGLKMLGLLFWVLGVLLAVIKIGIGGAFDVFEGTGIRTRLLRRPLSR